MDALNVIGLVKTAKDIQKPVSLAAMVLIVLYLIFRQIIGKIDHVDQKVLSAIINWIGLIALVAVVMSIISYSLPFFLAGGAGELEAGPPTIKKSDPK